MNHMTSPTELAPIAAAGGGFGQNGAWARLNDATMKPFTGAISFLCLLERTI